MHSVLTFDWARLNNGKLYRLNKKKKHFFKIVYAVI